MIQTTSFGTALPADLLLKYEYLETGSAADIIRHLCPDEFADIVDVLSGFWLTSRLLLSEGKNRGPVPTLIDTSFERRGWQEARIDLYKRAFRFPGQRAKSVKDEPFGERANAHLISETYQEGYSVDNFRGRVALDVEWNPKDGNLDRDLSAYRAWHSEGMLDAAVLITRVNEDTREITNQEWQRFIDSHPEHAGAKQPVNYRTTTTANFEKAKERIIRGDQGSCPILLIGIGRSTWDEEPWDGLRVRYDGSSKSLVLSNAFDKDDTIVETYPFI